MKEAHHSTGESVYFDEAGVKVTPSRFIVADQVYAMRNIVSVSCKRFHPPYGKVGLIAVCIALASIGISEARGIVMALLIIILLLLYALFSKSAYCVLLTTSAGETTAYKSKDKSHIEKIIKGLNEAIINRG
ncbi:MAG TPA: DUF6232 family protein [Chthoniobacteraceae bacterium]|nr:DUF6232 family protein [Chthoniobacteraceae bacterium]